jgi:hypothetical protein
MKVGIKAGYSMDLTYGNMYPSRKLLELVAGQEAEISLYGPQFFEHDAKDSALRLLEVEPCVKMARARML